MINEQFYKTLVVLDHFSIHQIGLSSLVKGCGNLNAECTVLPPGSNIAAIPNEVTAITMLSTVLTWKRINLVTNIFLVPPGASRNIR